MKKILIIALFSLTIASTLQAQYDYTLYNMDYIPQVQYTNPSSMPKCRWYWNGFVFPIAPINTYQSFSHTGFEFKDLYEFTPDDSIVVDLKNAASKMGKRNYVTHVANQHIIDFGFKARESYLSFAWNARTFTRFTYPGDLFKFITEGNGTDENLGKRFDFDGIGLDHWSYMEFSMNFARNINDQLSIGVRPKLLWGFANTYTRTSRFGILTEKPLYDITLDAEMNMQTSGIETLTDSSLSMNDKIDRILFAENKNWGWGVDLGATYRINDVFTVSGSLLDVGAIRWKYNTIDFTSKDFEFTYDGYDLVEAYLLADDSSEFDPFTTLFDTIQTAFGLDSNRGNVYTTPLPSRIYLSGKYNIGEQTNVAFLSSSTWNRGRYAQGISFSINHRIKRWLGLSASLSSYNRKLINMGAGFSINGGPFQFYAITDNFLAAFAPMRTKNTHVRLGFNATFGRKPRDMDNDGIEDKKDACPAVAGLEEFDGCPDTDEDGIPDKDDDCPTDYGPMAYNGCPDTDKDSIIDKIDACPEIFGLRVFDGCPDVDGDSIPDKDDACPEEKGLKEFNGCPDTDGDGIVDKDDDCPEVPGPKDNNGCPKNQLAIMNDNGDTLQIATKNEDDLYVFRNLDPLKDYNFAYLGTDTLKDGDLTVLLLNEDHVMRLKTIQSEENRNNFNYWAPKIQAIDEDGNVVEVVVRGKDGKYVFKRLDPDHSYTFMAIGDEQRVPSELDIIIDNPDGVAEIKPEKDSDNSKKFHYTPLKSDDVVRLNLLDKDGNVILTSEMDDKGMFIFKNLDPDESYTFQLEGSDPRLESEVPIMYMTDDGLELISAKLDGEKLYKYEKLKKPLEELKVELKAEEKAVIDKAFDNLEFETSLTVIKEHSLESLNEMAELVKKHKNWAIKIVGHTDDVGSEEDNMKLSERRAKAVELYFAQEGVAPSHMIVEWHGETKPIADNDTPEGRQKNRRVELDIVEIKE